MNIILTFGIAFPVGFVFYLVGLPLPWVLGPLSATLIYNAFGANRVRWPVGLRNGALIVIGYSMGRTVTVETTQQVFTYLPAMLVVTLLSIFFSAGLGYIIHRQTGISLASGVIGSMPGGLAQMVLLGEEVEDADMTVVTFMQMARLIVVVFLVPFVATYGIAHLSDLPVLPPGKTAVGDLVAALPAMAAAPLGALLAHLMRMPTPYLLGPICTTAAMALCGYPAPPVPMALLNLCLVFFGIYLGKSMTVASLRRLGKVFPFAVGNAILLVFFTFLLGLGLTFFTSATLITTFLGTAPGGLAEMGVVALGLEADAAFVLAYQLFRVFFILLFIPPFLKWRFKR